MRHDVSEEAEVHDQMTIPDYPLTQTQIDQYRRDGFIQLDDVIPADVLQIMRAAIERAVDEETKDGAAASPPGRTPSTLSLIHI